MSGQSRRVILVALSLMGCTLATPEADDVVSLEVCPEGNCDYHADGESLIPVKVCAVPHEDRATDLKAALTASEGSWQSAGSSSPREIEIELGRNRCREVRFVTSTNPRDVVIEAELSGFTQSETIKQVPAPIESIVLTPAPTTLARDAPNTIQLSASIRATRGVPSKGTSIEFSVVSTKPADQFVGFFPVTPVVDDKGMATTTVVVNQGVTDVVVSATATAPEGGSVTQELELAATKSAD